LQVAGSRNQAYNAKGHCDSSCQIKILNHRIICIPYRIFVWLYVAGYLFFAFH
jgi:hypothetical protein